MGNQMLKTERETNALREIYAAVNRNDIPAALANLDPEIEWIEPDHWPGGGTTHGLAAVTALFTRALGTWAEGSCEPEAFVVAGDKIVVLVHVHVRLKDTVEWIDGRLADVYTFRNGTIIQKRTFGEKQEAFEWAGVDTSNAS